MDSPSEITARYRIGDIIHVSDRMQRDYIYEIAVNPGDDFGDSFEPFFTPAEMLTMGVFEGKYCNDCRSELPSEWFSDARMAEWPDPGLNYFGVKSRQSLSVWRDRGWIIGDDPRGWFQWYCRYWLGRRIPSIDIPQIKRWRAFRRHQGQVRTNCEPGDIFCRRRQRQALLQWSHDPLI
jgi:hypothetical protein